MDMTPFLDNKSKTPLYRQLYDYFKQEISHARITKGMKLPFQNHFCPPCGSAT